MSELSKNVREIAINSTMLHANMTDGDKLIKFTSDFLELIKPLTGNSSLEIESVSIDPTSRYHRGCIATVRVANLQDVYPGVKGMTVRITVDDE